jgi:hypothetical protein
MRSNQNSKIATLPSFTVLSTFQHSSRCCIRGLQIVYYYCPSSSGPTSLLVIQPVTYNTSGSPSSILYHLQPIAFFHSPCLPPTEVPLSLQVALCWSSLLLLSTIKDWLLPSNGLASSLTMQRLPKVKPHYYLS